jgi:ribokinase
MDALHDMNPTVCLAWEPSGYHLEAPRQMWEQVLSIVALFSPDREEAAALCGAKEPDDMVSALLDLGAPLVALRMGARGSLVGSQTGERWRIPAVPTTIVDVTGAGNSYCGGFLTGLGDGLTPLESALRAAVSASFALEQFGLPQWGERLREERERRLAWAREWAE